LRRLCARRRDSDIDWILALAGSRATTMVGRIAALDDTRQDYIPTHDRDMGIPPPLDHRRPSS
jgi:hypothetical protein